MEEYNDYAVKCINDSSFGSSKENFLLPSDFVWTMVVLHGLVIAVGGLGSSSLLVAFVCDRRLWKPGYVLVSFLAFSDLVHLVVVGTFKILFLLRGNWLTPGRTRKPDDLDTCALTAFVMFYMIEVSLLNSVLIAFNRYVRVFHSIALYGRLFSHGAVWAWVLGVLTFATLGLMSSWGCVRYDPKLPGCFNDLRSTPTALSLLALLILLSCCAVAALYGFMLYRVRALGRKVRSQGVSRSSLTARGWGRKTSHEAVTETQLGHVAPWKLGNQSPTEETRMAPSPTADSKLQRSTSAAMEEPLRTGKPLLQTVPEGPQGGEHPHTGVLEEEEDGLVDWTRPVYLPAARSPSDTAGRSAREAGPGEGKVQDHTGGFLSRGASQEEHKAESLPGQATPKTAPNLGRLIKLIRLLSRIWYKDLPSAVSDTSDVRSSKSSDSNESGIVNEGGMDELVDSLAKASAKTGGKSLAAGNRFVPQAVLKPALMKPDVRSLENMLIKGLTQRGLESAKHLRSSHTQGSSLQRIPVPEAHSSGSKRSKVSMAVSVPTVSSQQPSLSVLSQNGDECRGSSGNQRRGLQATGPQRQKDSLDVTREKQADKPIADSGPRAELLSAQEPVPRLVVRSPEGDLVSQRDALAKISSVPGFDAPNQRLEEKGGEAPQAKTRDVGSRQDSVGTKSSTVSSTRLRSLFSAAPLRPPLHRQETETLQSSVRLKRKRLLRQPERVRSIKFGLMACVLNMTCYLPFCFVRLNETVRGEEVPGEVVAFSHLAVLLASALNCVAYGFMNSNYQQSALVLRERTRKVSDKLSAKVGKLSLPRMGIKGT